MTNLEKSKELRGIRKSLGLTQEAMAHALELDPSYLSQLENARRPIDDWYLQKARRVKAGFEKEESVKLSESTPAYEADPTREACLEHLNAFLDSCGTDTRKLGWTYVELKERFPLDKWAEPKQVNSVSPSEVEDLLDAAESVLDAEDRARLSKQKSGAGEPSGKKDSPSAGDAKGSKEPHDVRERVRGKRGS